MYLEGSVRVTWSLKFSTMHQWTHFYSSDGCGHTHMNKFLLKWPFQTAKTAARWNLVLIAPLDVLYLGLGYKLVYLYMAISGFCGSGYFNSLIWGRFVISGCV